MLHDIRYALRSLTKRFRLSLLIISITGIGIGSVVTVYSVVDSFLIRPVPFSEADRLVWLQSQSGNGALMGVSHADHQDWEELEVFEEIALFNAQNHAVISFDDGAESVLTTRTSSALFRILKVRPHLGRVWGEEEDLADAGRSVLLGYEIWQQRFGGSESVLGQWVRVDGMPREILGVLPPTFDFPAESQLWIPNSSWADQWPQRGVRVDSALGKLTEEAAVPQAKSALASLGQVLEEQYPDSNAEIRPHVRALREVWAGDVRSGLWFLLLACSLLLLITCFNVAGLLLLGVSLREKENAIRLALGISNLQLARQQLLEGLALSLTGGAVGLVLSFLSLEFIFDVVAVRIPTWMQPTMDWRILVFTLLTSIATGALFSLGPVLRVVRNSSMGALRELAGAGGGRRVIQVRRNLASFALAIALALLIGAGLLTKSFTHLTAVETGFYRQTVTFQLDLPIMGLESFQQVRSFYDQVLERVDTLPGVETSGASTSMPLVRRGSWDLWPVTLEHQTHEEQLGNPRVYGQGVSQDYFQAMGIRLLRGRHFSSPESGDGVAIVSRRFAEIFWGTTEVVGKRLRLGPHSAATQLLTVVGVVEDTVFESVPSSTGPALYLPLNEMLSWPLYVALETKVPVNTLIPLLVREVNLVSSDLAVRDVALIADHLERSLWRQRLWVVVFQAVSLMAILLSAMGFWGFMSHLISSRTQELAIRQSLGATRQDIRSIILGLGARLSLVGISLGFLVSFLLGRLIEGLLFDVEVYDPGVLLLSVLLVSAVVAVASILTFRRVMQAELAAVLKCS